MERKPRVRIPQVGCILSTVDRRLYMEYSNACKKWMFPKIPMHSEFCAKGLVNTLFDGIDATIIHGFETKTTKYFVYLVEDSVEFLKGEWNTPTDTLDKPCTADVRNFCKVLVKN